MPAAPGGEEPPQASGSPMRDPGNTRSPYLDPASSAGWHDMFILFGVASIPTRHPSGYRITTRYPEGLSKPPYAHQVYLALDV